jgi:transcriptional regulator with AAA-type ATPase domain
MSKASVRQIRSKQRYGPYKITSPKNLQKHIHEVIPEEYQKYMVGMKRKLKQILEIA